MGQSLVDKVTEYKEAFSIFERQERYKLACNDLSSFTGYEDNIKEIIFNKYIRYSLILKHLKLVCKKTVKETLLRDVSSVLSSVYEDLRAYD